MMMPEDETIMAEKASLPAGMTSRRHAIGAMGAVSVGMIGAAMPALGKAPAATPLREPTPPPVLVPRGDLVAVRRVC
jgi:hypothetical protein